MTDKKILIAYYSYSGNTKAVAEKIQTVTGGDLFEIETKVKYPSNYDEVVNQAKTEKQNDVRPELINNGDVSNYDIIFVGTPVWWYTMASPVKTFLANNNFYDKIIVPFCTHGGGGASSTYTDMQKLAPNAKILNGYTSYEKTANLKDVENWIKGLNL
ncbi:MAG: NAD(P)H-dependent oxidoreductase [Candidatus Gastranaerophilales bacterium]|nr:NAD(P)H-dependent oxidoreductase [Candidatus Gastranaerophilales bacterium]